MWINKLKGKKYVGSSINLRRRLLEYYNINRLLNEKCMPINVALLKYGYHNFSLTILEICEVDNLMSREKHFFNKYSPEYNILNTPGSPSRGSGWRHSEATIENMRLAANNRVKSPEVLAKLSAAQPNGMKIEVIDLETNSSTVYDAIKGAARALSIDRRYIEHYIYLNQDKPVLGRYTFKLINSNNKKVEKAQKSSKKIEVTNINNKDVTIYTSIGAAARALGYRQASISLYLKENRIKPFKGIYLFKLVQN
jgi:group I intron endonuclease